MLKAVIFDVDGTLYDYHKAHMYAFDTLSAYACDTFALTTDQFDALHRDADRLLRQRCGDNNAAIHNRLIRYQLILEMINKPIAYAPKMEEIYWTSLLSVIRPYEGLDSVFKSIKSMGLVLGIGTNMTADWQYAKLEALGIMPFVDFLVTSEEAGAEKPDKRIFDLCAWKAGCLPSECAYVGDSLNGDVLGSKAAGMCPVWLCPDASGIEWDSDTMRIASLQALSELLSNCISNNADSYIPHIDVNTNQGTGEN